MADVSIDEFECDEENCDAAYPHPLLVEYHKLHEHPEWAAELDDFIEGENRIAL